ncbi:hypothetical protein YC2023_043070 [Brassica napus]
MQQSKKHLINFVLHHQTLEAIYSVWWYISVSNQIGYLISPEMIRSEESLEVETIKK